MKKLLAMEKRDKGGNKTPGWIVSFTDMITLLLSFFIMLQAMAKEKDTAAFYAGQGGFRRAVAGLGVPDWLLGKPEKPDLGYQKPKHTIEEDEDNLNLRRVIDPTDENIRQVFDQLRRLMNTRAQDYEGRPARLISTPIVFAPGESEPDKGAAAFLRDFAFQLGQDGGPAPAVHVVGLAPDTETEEARWLLSVARARAVEALMREALEAAPTQAAVDSWGAGPGGPWCGRTEVVGPATRFIVLAVMDADEKE